MIYEARPGGGRKRTVELDPTLRADLEALIEPTSRGDSESPLRWTTKSVHNLAAELGRQGHRVSYRIVGELLHELGYSLRANRKTLEGTSHPDRDAQLRHIHAAVQLQLSLGEPVVSVDTKKRELVGPVRNGGKELRPKGDPEPVRIHDFVIPELGRASPYGVYDLAANEAWVSVGVDHDTADCGGSNGYRIQLWKPELQKLADETDLEIAVHHSPPGTSKWNKVEHRLFSAMAGQAPGEPRGHRRAHRRHDMTWTGLRVRSELDTNAYPKGVTVPDADVGTLLLRRDDSHGEWNYSLFPRLTLPQGWEVLFRGNP